jgi:hypothetical protein
MDLRVINWVHRATRGWSFGNSVVDPRTGEIIKVSLGSLRVRQDYLIAQGLLAHLKMVIYPPIIKCCKWPTTPKTLAAHGSHIGTNA